MCCNGKGGQGAALGDLSPESEVYKRRFANARVSASKVLFAFRPVIGCSRSAKKAALVFSAEG